MSKIILGKTPKTFAPVAVKFPMPDGTEGVIQTTFKYRTRMQYGEFLNEVFEVNKSAEVVSDAKEGDEQRDFQKIFGETRDKTAARLAMAIDSWDLDVELNQESLQQLADELPAAVVALQSAYETACTVGRLGN